MDKGDMKDNHVMQPISGHLGSQAVVQGLLIYLHFSLPFYRTQILAAHLLKYKEDGDLGLHKNKSIVKQQAHTNRLAYGAEGRTIVRPDYNSRGGFFRFRGLTLTRGNRHELAVEGCAAGRRDGATVADVILSNVPFVLWYFTLGVKARLIEDSLKVNKGILTTLPEEILTTLPEEDILISAFSFLEKAPRLRISRDCLP
ncbi:hypothetical protein Taro_028587 [Colocasia esculenta]|uniref:Uncharacterized protein n=1 Tax=Colocasia esculenta TaxID=4460 RepID=A0A843VNK2_COLES|nr:hypothetical protein [Colocasia esculenta]